MRQQQQQAGERVVPINSARRLRFSLGAPRNDVVLCAAYIASSARSYIYIPIVHGITIRRRVSAATRDKISAGAWVRAHTKNHPRAVAVGGFYLYNARI